MGHATSLSFTWTDTVATGMVYTSTTTSMSGDTIPFDVSLDGQYRNDTTVQCECAGTSLKITGYAGGKYVWEYS